ncbi:MAG: EAL domain-containing protein [Gammaproteobacteria bacterium]|nr:EAL domain-containing protein [Gammaproteobacteria bacterium]
MDAKPLGNDHAADETSPAEQILGSLSDGVVGINRASEITFINPVACSLTGVTRGEIIGQPLSSVFVIEGGAHALEPDYIQRILNRQVGIGPITKQQLKPRSGESILIDYSITPLDMNLAVIMFHDLSHIEPANRTLLYQLSYDPLTHLPNRDTLQQTLNQAHNRFITQQGMYCVLLLDLDRFKLINDCYGHSTGDELLKQLARLMAECLRPQDSLGRWGGEEFICILPDTNLADGYAIAERIRKKLADHVARINSRDVTTTTSIGIASYPVDGATTEEILRVADSMLYEAKRDGRNTTFSSLTNKVNILSIASQLEEAIENDTIVPAYQPIVDLATGNIVADEVLARIDDKEAGLVEAGKFIDAALQLQLIHKIDHTIIKQAIMSCSVNVLSGGAPRPHFINISADLLRHPELVQDILDTAIAQCTACGDAIGDEKPLVIEITEHQLISNVTEAKRILQPFLDFGLRLAVDDFGSGYSSLHYLADLPVSFLKIEGSLIQRVTTDRKVRAIVKGIQNIADDLDLTTIAEYIENEVTYRALQDLGVSWGQGYYFGEPELKQ